MKNEAEFKAAFKKSVRAQGGFAISLAAPMLSGLPDIYCIMPGYCPILLEAKWLGEVKLKFYKKIQYTPMQKMYLDECCKVKDYTAMGLIGYKLNKVYWCTLMHPKLSYIDIHMAMPVEAKKNIFDIVDLFGYHPIPRINGIHATST